MVVATVVISLVLVFFGVCLRVVGGLSEFVGGLGGRMRFPACSAGVMTCSSGVMALSFVVPIGVGGLMSSLPVVRNDNFVCRPPFVSLSFAGVTFVCLVFAPRRGDEYLPVVPVGLRRFPDFLAMVGVIT